MWSLTPIRELTGAGLDAATLLLQVLGVVHVADRGEDLHDVDVDLQLGMTRYLRRTTLINHQDLLADVSGQFIN